LKYYFKNDTHVCAAIVGPYGEVWASSQDNYPYEISHENTINLFARFALCAKLGNCEWIHRRQESQAVDARLKTAYVFGKQWDTIAIDKDLWISTNTDAKEYLCVARIYRPKDQVNFGALVFVVCKHAPTHSPEQCTANLESIKTIMERQEG
jgi:hypothetical protein